jgi:hypothetical protein
MADKSKRDHELELAFDAIDLQNAEFDAAGAVCKALAVVLSVAVVDDEYPEVRHKYDSAVRSFIDALRANGRIPK